MGCRRKLSPPVEGLRVKPGLAGPLLQIPAKRKTKRKGLLRLNHVGPKLPKDSVHEVLPFRENDGEERRKEKNEGGAR